MSVGKVHETINNFFFFPIICLLAFVLKIKMDLIFSFSFGWLFATFIFSPDMDLRPKKSLGPFRFIFWPYSLLFRHRGLSHSLLFGTFTRLIYMAILMILFQGLYLAVLGKLQALHLGSWKDALFYFNYTFLPSKEFYLVAFAFFGMAAADLCHYFMDFLYSMMQKIRK
jgi:uncharacterized metal-binding protein